MLKNRWRCWEWFLRQKKGSSVNHRRVRCTLENGVGPNQLINITERETEKGAKIGLIMAFSWAKRSLFGNRTCRGRKDITFLENSNRYLGPTPLSLHITTVFEWILFIEKPCLFFPWPKSLTYNASRYTFGVMIRSFKCQETEKTFRRTFSQKWGRDIQQIGFRKLRMLNRAMTLIDLRLPPGNRLERLRGNREGQHSIRINDQWRICFEWRDGDAFNVEITDYH